MGLNVRVGEYNTKEYMCEEMGSYSRYNDWKRRIAKASGFNLDEMVGFDDKTTDCEGNIPWHKEPFQLILYHYDTDGLYSVNQLHLLLEEVNKIKQLGIDDFDQSDKFIRLITHAIKIKKPLMFE